MGNITSQNKPWKNWIQNCVLYCLSLLQQASILWKKEAARSVYIAFKIVYSEIKIRSH